MEARTPLQLEAFFTEALSYQARQGFDATRAPRERVDVSHSEFALKDAPNHIMVRLKVRIGQQEEWNARCELELKLVGFFRLPEELDPRLSDAMRTQNAPSILYGVARQIVAETTGNGPWGKVFLPTVNFVAMAAKKAPPVRPARAAADSPVVSDRPASAKRKPS